LSDNRQHTSKIQNPSLSTYNHIARTHQDFLKYGQTLREQNCVRLIQLSGLHVLLFPLQASRTGYGKEPEPASPVDSLPMLRGMVEFESAGPGDFDSAKLMQ
jgi:hypothetical protein